MFLNRLGFVPAQQIDTDADKCDAQPPSPRQRERPAKPYHGILGDEDQQRRDCCSVELVAIELELVHKLVEQHKHQKSNSQSGEMPEGVIGK